MQRFVNRNDPAFQQERGRLAAVQAILDDPIKRAEMEARFGVERCKQRYPEVYQTRFERFFHRFMDTHRIWR